jgi:hypothetical protein
VRAVGGVDDQSALIAAFAGKQDGVELQMDHKKHIASDPSDETASAPKPAPQPSFWRSRVGITLLISLSVAALLLGFEHRIHIFAGNGLLILLLVGCGAMHLFMHGGHGGHGGGDKS